MNTAIVCFYGGNHYLLNRQINKILKEEQNPLAFACRDYDELDELVPVLREDFDIDKLIILHEDANIDRFERAAEAEYSKLFESLEIGIDFSKERKDFFEEVNIPHHLLEDKITGAESQLRHGSAHLEQSSMELSQIKAFVLFPLNPPVIANTLKISKIAKLMNDYEQSGYRIINSTTLDCATSGFWGLSSIQCCSIIKGGESLKNKKYTHARSKAGLYRLYQQQGLDFKQFPTVIGVNPLLKSFEEGKFTEPEGVKSIDDILKMEKDELEKEDKVTRSPPGETPEEEYVEQEPRIAPKKNGKQSKFIKMPNSLIDNRRRIREGVPQLPAPSPANNYPVIPTPGTALMAQSIDDIEKTSTLNYNGINFNPEDNEIKVEIGPSTPVLNQSSELLTQQYKDIATISEVAVKQAKIAYQIGLEMLQLKKYNMKSKISSTKNLIPGKYKRIDKLREEWINNKNNKLMFLTKILGDIEASRELGNTDHPELEGSSLVNEMLSKLGVYKDVSAISKDLRAGGLGLVLDASSVIMKRLAKGKNRNTKFDHLFGHPRFNEFQELFSDDIVEAGD